MVNRFRFLILFFYVSVPCSSSFSYFGFTILHTNPGAYVFFVSEVVTSPRLIFSDLDILFDVPTAMIVFEFAVYVLVLVPFSGFLLTAKSTHA